MDGGLQVVRRREPGGGDGGGRPTRLPAQGQGVSQSSFSAMGAWPEKSCRTGLASAPGTPKVARAGPMARTMTVFGVLPPMMKPPIITCAPVWTRLRVEILVRRAGASAWLLPAPPTPNLTRGPW